MYTVIYQETDLSVKSEVVDTKEYLRTRVSGLLQDGAFIVAIFEDVKFIDHNNFYRNPETGN